MKGTKQVIILALGLLLGIGAKAGQRGPDPTFFDNPKMREIRLEPSEAAVKALQGDNRRFVAARVRIDERTFRDVGIHLKGHGSFRPLAEKPSFTLKFDEFTPDQTWDGFTTLWLNNSVQDGTYLNELVCRGIYRDAGIPAARVTYARVRLRDRDMGLYLVLEAVNKQMLRQYFSNVSGNLYKPYVQDIDQPMPQESGPGADRADLKALVAAAREPDLKKRWQQLQRLVDTDSFLKFVAVEMMVCHWDGYVNNRNNYLLYHDPDSDRLWFITNDLDGALGDANAGLRPPQNQILCKGFFEVPEARWRYRWLLPQVYTNAFRVEVLTNRLQQAVTRMISLARNTNEVKEYLNFGNTVRDRVVGRGKGIARILDTEPEQLLIGAEGFARPANWKSKAIAGRAVCTDDTQALRIALTNGAANASWQARVYLPPGRYSFEGSVRTAGLKPPAGQTNGGAFLAVGGVRADTSLQGDTPATLMRQTFEVQDGDKGVDLNCELQGAQGEAWFDVASLKILPAPGL